MENQNGFIYQYSAARNREVESIRKKYLPREERKMDILRRLDRQVQSAGIIPALCTGIVGTLVFGIGMCFGLDVFAGGDWLSILFCFLGTVIMIPAYFVYRYLSEKAREELSPEILRLSEEIIQGQKN